MSGVIEKYLTKRVLAIIIPILLFVIVSAIIIILDTKKWNKYYSQTIEITYQDSLNLKIENVWMNHGYLYFNDKYYLISARMNPQSLSLQQVTELETPFTIIKKSFSDTILLQYHDRTYLFTLKQTDNTLIDNK